MTGVIIKAISGFYYVECNNSIYECKARGVFRDTHVTPTVGDNADITVISDDKGVVEKILPRKNRLSRPEIANIDTLFIVSSYSTPSPNTLIIDRLTAIAEHNGIESVIVFNKCDMGNFDDISATYKKAGFKTVITSAETGQGIEELKECLNGKISAFTGNSGVGKSSLLNILFPSLSLKTGEVSEKLGRGRHTTRHTQLYKHEYNGYVADTPGFSSLDMPYDVLEFKQNLPYCFIDFKEYLNSCKFTSCTHIAEKGCSICEAVKRGEISLSRHESYVAIYDELKNIKEWQFKK